MLAGAGACTGACWARWATCTVHLQAASPVPPCCPPALQAFAPWPAERLAEIGGGRRAYISQEADPAEAAQLGQASPEDAARQRLARAQSMFGGHPQCVQGEWEVGAADVCSPTHEERMQPGQTGLLVREMTRADLIASTDPAAITEHGQFHRDADSCRTYAQGRVALVGDAAHLATPFLGQGCSQALEDALEAGRAIGGWGQAAADTSGRARIAACSTRVAAAQRGGWRLRCWMLFWGDVAPGPTPALAAGAHGPTPEALAAYQAVRLPLAGAVQKESVQVGCGGCMAATSALHCRPLALSAHWCPPACPGPWLPPPSSARTSTAARWTGTSTT